MNSALSEWRDVQISNSPFLIPLTKIPHSRRLKNRVFSSLSFESRTATPCLLIATCTQIFCAGSLFEVAILDWKRFVEELCTIA